MTKIPATKETEIFVRIEMELKSTVLSITKNLYLNCNKQILGKLKQKQNNKKRKPRCDERDWHKLQPKSEKNLDNISKALHYSTVVVAKTHRHATKSKMKTKKNK